MSHTSALHRDGPSRGLSRALCARRQILPHREEAEAARQGSPALRAWRLQPLGSGSTRASPHTLGPHVPGRPSWALPSCPWPSLAEGVPPSYTCGPECSAGWCCPLPGEAPGLREQKHQATAYGWHCTLPGHLSHMHTVWAVVVRPHGEQAASDWHKHATWAFAGLWKLTVSLFPICTGAAQNGARCGHSDSTKTGSFSVPAGGPGFCPHCPGAQRVCRR